MISKWDNRGLIKKLHLKGFKIGNPCNDTAILVDFPDNGYFNSFEWQYLIKTAAFH